MDTSGGDARGLVERARQGDPDAWETLYRSVYPRLFAFARRRLADDGQADDAVSETMLRGMARIGSYTPTSEAGVEGWLFGIARLVVLETYRAGARARPVDPETLRLADHRTTDDPSAAMLAREEQTLVRRAFAALSPADQELLELRVVAGLDAAHVARVTDKRPGAVRTAQSRALQRLRLELEGLMA